MKKSTLLIAGTLLMTLSFTASATIIENWQFNDGEGIRAGDATNSAGTADWGSSALGASNYLNSAGQAVFSADGTSYFRAASGFNGDSTITSGTTYLRVDFTGWTFAQSSNSKTFSFGFADASVDQELIRLSKGGSATEAAITVNQDNASFHTALSGLGLTDSTGVSVIFGINLDNDTLSVWTDAGLTGSYTQQLTDIALIADFGDLTQLRFESLNMVSGDTVSMDMLVIGDNLSEIQAIPEPTSLSLVVIGALAPILIRRLRK